MGFLPRGVNLKNIRKNESMIARTLKNSPEDRAGIWDERCRFGRDSSCETRFINENRFCDLDSQINDLLQLHLPHLWIIKTSGVDSSIVFVQTTSKQDVCAVKSC